MSRRAIFGRIVASLVIFAATAELAVRATGLGSRPPTGYAPVMDRRLFSPKNSHGYRDEEHPEVKPPGVRRLLSLGDSVAFGVGVEFDDAYPQRLERKLRWRHKESWEVVNLALAGMNTTEQAEVFENEGLAYAPDVVLLGYCMNDAEDDRSAVRRRATDWASRRSRALPVWKHSAFLSFAYGRVGGAFENRQRIRSYHAHYADDASGWTASRIGLQRIGELCRKRGIPFFVAIHPLLANPLDERYPFRTLHEKVAEAARSAGATVIDLLPAYQGLRWDFLVVDGVNDEHPNEVAHRIAANALYRSFDGLAPRLALNAEAATR